MVARALDESILGDRLTAPSRTDGHPAIQRQGAKERKTATSIWSVFEAYQRVNFTALLRKSLMLNGAGEGNRTLVSGLGSPRSTIEPHPQSKALRRYSRGKCWFQSRSLAPRIFS